jgi:para-aminobenzoate synthetase / 4-amino-4-deoxychorismate lyase
MVITLQYTPPAGSPVWLTFRAPRQLLTVRQPSELAGALAQAEAAVADGLCVAGYLTYEAAPGCDTALRTRPPNGRPLALFGVYEDYQCHDALPLHAAAYTLSDWRPSIDHAAYAEAIRRIRDWIARGDTYQVNYTFRLHAALQGSPAGWFHDLIRAQRPCYAAYVETEDDVFCSASPELFWQLEGNQIHTRPMKGTTPRGLHAEADQEAADSLQRSEKDRAENLMIVDMMRNDLGRLAQPGSVRVDPLFAIEQYPTLYQMTSSVHATTDAGFGDIMRALFPSCSITGAPKVRTMELIADLETAPRGIYTGSIGCLLPAHPVTQQPGRVAQWNVAIRTGHIDKATGHVEYGTGGGVVWDSSARQERQEAFTKALILTPPPPTFDLLETLRWQPRLGYRWLDEHLARMAASARYFGYHFDPITVRRALADLAATLPAEPHRVRLCVNADGQPRLTSTPLQRQRPVWRVALDSQPVPRDHVFLYHKTTHRPVYDDALRRHPNHDDVLLWNEAEELTESCLANLALQIDGIWYTPPRTSGLLGGTLRAVLLRRGHLQERVLHRADLARASRVGLINSVRGFIPVNQG